ncbi:protein-tyrosine-phosphatase [Hamadaea flava]|uniref:Three-helix bundle dimerization domain-containing protein n=1 Tax=Hamadaea flava TaxID=1742688 RepID=A0ABV8LPA0_9ACTN|nr:arsenate reductase ArsC [Hamadaea flava]MCP2323284.1 protein-tyrosine-phosphatase [Hamadaea flava]
MTEPAGWQMPTLISPEATLARAAEQLADKYKGVFSLETILRYLDESYTLLAATAKVTGHLPNLAVHFATDRLAAIAKNDGSVITGIPEVLFVCVHNAGRSQMAAALLDHHAAGQVHVRSAGSTPAAEISPAVVAALAEVGVDVTKDFPKPLTDEVVRASDVVVLMGCGDACPIYPGKRYLDWDLPDPASLPIGQVRPIRDEIDRRVRVLLTELTDQGKESTTP